MGGTFKSRYPDHYVINTPVVYNNIIGEIGARKH